MNEYTFYKIRTDLSFEDNVILRDQYYTKEVLDSYDIETRSIIMNTVLNDDKFHLLYDLKTQAIVRFVSLSQKQYELFLLM